MDLHCELTVDNSLWIEFQRSLISWTSVARKPRASEPTPSPIQVRESTRQLRKNRVSRNFFEPPVWEKKPTRPPIRQDSMKDNDRWFLLGNTFSVSSSSSSSSLRLSLQALAYLCVAILNLIFSPKKLLHCLSLLFISYFI